MKQIFITFMFFLFCAIAQGENNTYQYQWTQNETPEGQETVTPIKPIYVTFLDENKEVADNSAALMLQQRYSVYLSTTWTHSDASKLLETFESIPQERNHPGHPTSKILPISFWELSYQHIHNDIDIQNHGEEIEVTLAADALTYAQPLLAEIEGIQGRYFSKRLHQAVVRYATDNGTDKRAIRGIFKERYAVSIDIPNYTELTRHTTVEDADSFQEFTSEEIIVLLSMLEEFPTGMLKIPGLKYLVRRKDGMAHPINPAAAGAAWASAGYIEFMQKGFRGKGHDAMHRLILHEKAHFLWHYLFDAQLKKDWIELGGWYENENGWTTTEETNFVSEYAHGHNPEEDMAESISFYIKRPDVLRSRAPAKYEFIQNRIMHGTRYISRIREDLTFQVYNLYPDYVYPGRIVRVDAQVKGAPTEDKEIIIMIELHHEDNFDLARSGYIELYNRDKKQKTTINLRPVDTHNNRVHKSHILRGTKTLSKFAPEGYLVPDRIWISDGINTRYSDNEFSLKLYIDNPLADYEPPEYVPNSLRLSLEDEFSKEGRKYQKLNIKFNVTDASDFGRANIPLIKEDKIYNRELYFGKVSNYVTGEISAYTLFPDYSEGGVYSVWKIQLRDIVDNKRDVYFLELPSRAPDYAIRADEESPTIEIITQTPDTIPPTLDINNITIRAEPTNPEAPNGETRVYITYSVKDDISGLAHATLSLRDSLGTLHQKGFIYNNNFPYFSGDPTVYKEYPEKILLPIGSPPGTWGLAQMRIGDWAGNVAKYDFTETLRFDVIDEPTDKYDLNGDGNVNILDLVIIANAFGESNEEIDINGDGVINIQDLVIVANAME